MNRLTKDWMDVVGEEFEKPYFKDLIYFLEKEYMEELIFPRQEDIYNAFLYTSFSRVKVIILGQDPYHDEGQAHGLSFSVKPNMDVPPSLVNIYKELENDLRCNIPNHGYLKNWADQGVFLLNTVLTVRAHQPNSHKGKGWEKFTDAVILKLNELDQPMVFLLWGKQAQEKKKMLNHPNHLIIESPHPSPLSSYRGFFHSKPFSRTNEYLRSNGLDPIDWQLKNL